MTIKVDNRILDETIIKIIKTFWNSFVKEDLVKETPDEYYKFLNSNNAALWLGEDIVSLVVNYGINKTIVFDRLNNIINNYKYADEIKKRLDLLKVTEEINIRSDWRNALKTHTNVYNISTKIRYGLSKRDIKELAKLHKRGWYRNKIEDLLEDCNFHMECSDFVNHNYEEYLKYI